MKMKVFAIFVMISTIVDAQDSIPNGDFEYWHSGCAPGACLYCPDNWWIFCDFSMAWGLYKDTNAYNGNFAIRGRDAQGLQILSPTKFKLNSHPAAFSCYVKSSSPVDSLWFEIDLFYNSSLVDSGWKTYSNFTNAYSKYVIPITQNSIFVDSASIAIRGFTSSGNYFLLDYMNFDSTYSEINDFAKNDLFEIFPNPTSGLFTIQMNNGQLSIDNYQLSIYNVYGEKVAANFQINSSSNCQIDLSEAPSGVYFLQLSTDKGIARKKIVISK